MATFKESWPSTACRNDWPTRLHQVLGGDFVYEWYKQEASKDLFLDDSIDLPPSPVGCPSRDGEKWTPTECERLFRLRDMGVPLVQVSLILGRSKSAVSCQISRNMFQRERWTRVISRTLTTIKSQSQEYGQEDGVSAEVNFAGTVEWELGQETNEEGTKDANDKVKIEESDTEMISDNEDVECKKEEEDITMDDIQAALILQQLRFGVKQEAGDLPMEDI